MYEDPPASFKEVIDAVRTLEETTLSSNRLFGTVLRYGFFYGPGTVYASDGSFAEDTQKRRVSIAGGGTGVFSFIHIEDAATATLAALECDESGICNIVDDDPAPLAEWLPASTPKSSARANQCESRAGSFDYWPARMPFTSCAIKRDQQTKKRNRNLAGYQVVRRGDWDSASRPCLVSRFRSM